MSDPIISVVLPVYNGSADVRAAIDSILAQTFEDFELIVIDDGSKDDTAQVVAAVTDPRLVFVHQANQGLAATLNRGLAMARGKYVARMDHDDRALPTRFAKQVAYLDAHPDCALLGTHSQIWEGDTPTKRGHFHPTGGGTLRFELLFDNPFVHASVMLRRDAILALGGYTTDPSRQPPEDFELWSRVARHHKVANLPEQLLIYREVAGSISRSQSFQEKLVLLCAENLAHAVGATQPDRDMIDIAALVHRHWPSLSLRPNMGRMHQILREAARRIDAEEGDDCASRLVSAMQERLCLQATVGRVEQLPPWLRRPVLTLGRIAVRSLRLARRVAACGMRALLRDKIAGRRVVGVKLCGGLGNQMFQYAAGLRLANDVGAPLILDVAAFADDPQRSYQLDHFAISGRVMSPVEAEAMRPTAARLHPRLSRLFGRLLPSGLNYVRETGFTYDPAVLRARPPAYLDGYWQSERYFVAMAERVRKEFALAQPMSAARQPLLAAIRGVMAVSVHVRRGDYVSNPAANAYHGTCAPEWYSQAIARMAALVDGPVFFVFSDDPDWARANLTVPDGTTFVDPQDDGRDFEDMHLMAACRHHIIANSSFSWWGAWLNPSPDKRVIAPARWFAGADHDTRDLLPPTWIRL